MSPADYRCSFRQWFSAESALRGPVRNTRRSVMAASGRPDGGQLVPARVAAAREGGFDRGIVLRLGGPVARGVARRFRDGRVRLNLGRHTGRASVRERRRSAPRSDPMQDRSRLDPENSLADNAPVASAPPPIGRALVFGSILLELHTAHRRRLPPDVFTRAPAAFGGAGALVARQLPARREPVTAASVHTLPNAAEEI